jgi:hypothetical protein
LAVIRGSKLIERSKRICLFTFVHIYSNLKEMI